jgi:Tol biopolymer transport system component
LIQNKYGPGAFSFSPDGKRLAFWQSQNTTTRSEKDIWILPLDLRDPENPKPGEPERFLATPFNELHPVFSPDGHWIAYSSDASGVHEVYVRPFPGPGGQGQVSVGGGYLPMWRKDGRLLYETNDNRFMAVDYKVSGDSFEPGKPRLWSNTRVMEFGLVHNASLAPDGNRVVVFPRLQSVEEEKGTVHVTFLLNFFDYLRRQAP